MTQHFTKNTISVSFFCTRCNCYTQHRIDSGRKGPCLKCLERPLPAKPAPAAKQQQLFTEE